MKRQMIVAFVIALTVSPATAQVRNAMHNGSLMTMTAGAGTLVIQYVNPRPDLYGLVGPGTVLVEGRWDGPQGFVGRAFVFSRLCGPMPYPVRGTVDQSSTLMLFGPAPQFDTSCRILGVDYNSSQAVLRFEPVR